MANEDTTHVVTRLLASIQEGEEASKHQLWELVYQELHGMACVQMAREQPGRTLQPTALVHEAFFRLFGSRNAQFQNRPHFFSAAARAMQRIRVDDARRRGRTKRGGNHRLQSLDATADQPVVFDQDPVEVLAVEDAMVQLELDQPQLAEVVRLRYFVGLTVEETADALEITSRTVANRWRIARAMLSKSLMPE